MNTPQCSKCSSTEKLQKHHVHPVCHFKRKGNNLKIWICEKCHCELEREIRLFEDLTRGSSKAKRFKLEKTTYEKILTSFLSDRSIIYVGV